EAHVLQDACVAVRRGEARCSEERQPARIRHRSAPPVKPRTIASAFAASMDRYVAPDEPRGPSVSPYKVKRDSAPVSRAIACVRRGLSELSGKIASTCSRLISATRR